MFEAIRLPDKPSDLIEVALGDLEKAELSPHYAVEMSDWHNPEEDECNVCLAGSVMAFSLNANPLSTLGPSFFGEHENKLLALDSFRVGNMVDGIFDATNGKYEGKEIRAMLREVGYEDYRNIPEYHRDPQLFKNSMKTMVDDLRSVGL